MPATLDPYAAPPTSAIRGPGRYLWWLVTSQPRRVARAATLGSLWMLGLTLSPYLLSRAIDDGLQRKDSGALTGWVAALFTAGVVNAFVGVLRHRTMTRIRMDATFRTVQAVVGQATRLGAALPRQVTAGEVVTIGISDVTTIAQTLTITGPGFGAVVAYLMVAVLLLSISPVLAAVVLAGVPVLAVLVGPLLGRLQKTGTVYREQQGELAARMLDILGGLRVLNGLGGKETHALRYRRGSQALRAEGYRVGAVASWLDALSVGLPALFLAVVTWLAARMAAQGTITVGELVAVYGYVAVLVVPVWFFIEGGSDLARAVVPARRVVRFLKLTPDSFGGARTVDAPAPSSVLRDPVSGVEVAPGRLTAIAGARPADAATVVDRLSRFTGTEATWGGIRLDEILLAQVRDRILVADNDADLFSGTLREAVAGRQDRDDAAISRAVHTAMAQDIVDALPDGLDSVLTAQGRNLSGGQRQRIRLVRALLADPEILLAVEPTSAVDAHTESVIAGRLRAARTGRTTVVATTSALLLDQADVVHHLVDGRAVAVGTHRDLLLTRPDYRALVSRGQDPSDDDSAADDDAGTGTGAARTGAGPRRTEVAR